MTVSSTTSSQTFACNGATTIFIAPFSVLEASSVRAYLITIATGAVVELVNGTDFTVSNVGDPNARVTTTVAYSASYQLRIKRITARLQETDYRDNDPFPAESHEDALDRLTMIAQEDIAALDRCVRVSDTGEALAELPSAASRANNLLGFDAQGDIAVVVPNAQSAAALALALASNSLPTNGAGLVGWDHSQTYAADTVGHKLRERVSVMDFGAKLDGVTADDAAFDAAIGYFSSGNGEIYIPAGQMLLTAGHDIDKDRIHLVGAGSYASRILFAPTADSTCIRVRRAGAIVTQGSIRGISFYSTDATYTKTAIEIEDSAAYAIDDVVVSGGVEAVTGSYFWAGGTGSIGIRLRGREATRIKGITIYANRPVVISGNPNHSIDSDHTHFSDTYLGASAGWANVEIEDGANVTNLTFDGYNAWVLGDGGLKWIDTTSAQISSHLTIKNMRAEQILSTSVYVIDVQHNTGLQSLTIEDCQGGVECNGYRFRKVKNLTIKNNLNAGGVGRTHLDVDSTVVGIRLDNCFWQAAGSASMSGQRLVWGAPLNPNTAPLPPSAIYDSTSNTFNTVSSESAIGGYTVTVANDGVVSLGVAATTAGMLSVLDSEYLAATFNLRGSYNTASEVADPATVYSTTENNASTTNVYYHAGSGTYRLQNKRGAERRYRIQLIGSYEAF